MLIELILLLKRELGEYQRAEAWKPGFKSALRDFLVMWPWVSNGRLTLDQMTAKLQWFDNQCINCSWKVFQMIRWLFFTWWCRSGLSKLQIVWFGFGLWHVFCMTNELRTGFTFLNGWDWVGSRSIYIIFLNSPSWSSKAEILTLVFYRKSLLLLSVGTQTPPTLWLHHHQ